MDWLEGKDGQFWSRLLLTLCYGIAISTMFEAIWKGDWEVAAFFAITGLAEAWALEDSLV